MTELEKKRKENGYIQQKMADMLKISVSSYNMYENNQRKIPVYKAQKIADILGCNLNEIFLPAVFTTSEIMVREAN